MKEGEEKEGQDLSKTLMRKTLLISFLLHFFMIMALGFRSFSLPNVMTPKGEIWDVSLIKIEKPKAIEKKAKVIEKKKPIETPPPKKEEIVKVKKVAPKKEKEIVKVKKEEIAKLKEEDLKKEEEEIAKVKKEQELKRKEVKQLAKVQKEIVEPRPFLPTPQPPLQAKPSTSASLSGLSASPEGNLPPELAWYIEKIRRLVWQNWEEPRYGIPKGKKVKVVIRFEIDRKGQFKAEPVVFQSSQLTLLDQSGLRAIVRTEPFPPLPKGYGDDSLGIRFGFEYGEEEI